MVKSIRIISFFTFLLVFLSGNLAFSQEHIPAEQVKVETPKYSCISPICQPALGEYVYTASWQGIPVATAKILAEKKEERLVVTISVKTVKAIDVFYRLRYHAESYIDLKSMHPIEAIYNKKENSRRRNINMSFEKNGDIVVNRVSNGNKEDLRFNTGNFTLDPITAAMIARGLNWDSDDTKTFDSYEGKNRYLVSLKSVGRKKVSVRGKEYNVWEIKPKVEKVSSHKKNKLRDASIYLTADDKRDLVLIDSEVFIGSVKVKLDSFTPLNKLKTKK